MGAASIVTFPTLVRSGGTLLGRKIKGKEK